MTASERVLTDYELAELCAFAQKGQVQLIERSLEMYNLDDSPRQRRVGINTLFPERKPSPFVTAALNGQLKVVKYLLKRYPHAVPIDNTAETTLPHVRRYSSEMHVHSCSALFGACVNGHLIVIKYLVKVGASVNTPECCGATPLHAVLFYNRGFCIVDHLVRHGADINAADDLGQTPLMIAAGRGAYMLSTVKYLLKKGANMNHLDVKGYSALHYAAFHGDHRGVIELLSKGADPKFKAAPGPHEDSQAYVPCPLYLAASNGLGDVTREILKYTTCPPTCEAEAYLLLGSSQCETSRRWLSLYVEGMWSQALAIYEGNKISPSYLPPIAAYGNRKEIRSVTELQQLSSRSLSLHEAYYQSLIMRERCMGYGGQKLIHLLIHRGRVFMNQKKFQDAENLLFRALEMVLHLLNTTKGSRKAMFFNDDHQGASKISQYLDQLYEWMQRLIKEKYTPSFPKYLKLALSLVESLMKQEDNQSNSKGHPFDYREVFCCIFSLFLIWLQDSGSSGDDDFSLVPDECEEIGNEFVHRHLFTLPDFTLLHLALSEYYLLKRRTSYESLTNISPLLIALLRWGADRVVDEPTSYGQRPLHMAVYLANCEGQLVVPILLRHGAHLDAVNRTGKTASDLCTSPELEGALFPSTPLPLACQVCRFVVSNGFPYQDIDLPPHIKHLISMHNVML